MTDQIEPVEKESTTERSLTDPVADEGDRIPEFIPEATRPKRPRKGIWILFGILFIVFAVLVGAAIGYKDGLNRRMTNQESKVLERASQQLELSYQDISKGSYENARKRLEYILSIYPGFPGVPELLVEVNLKLAVPTPTPTIEFMPMSTPEITATPDLRGAEEIFSQIEQAIRDQQWSLALEEIARIRDSSYSYRTVDVDGYYYIALRNDGIQKIYAGQLEQGMFELSTAEQLGGLDGQADGARALASMYITAASYWDTNWPEAIRLFGELSNAYPGLRDSSGLTSTDRYRLALAGFAKQINNTGDPCAAVPYYQQSLAIYADPNVQQEADYAIQACDLKNQATVEPEPTAMPETPTEPAPTEEPTPEPTP